MPTKILLLGLDGATFDLILLWAQAGLLPTLSRFMQEGTWGPLHSTTPPLSPVAWPSFATGTNPGQHGIFNFLARRLGTYDWYPVSSSDRIGLPFWVWAGQHGFQTGVFNMPMTYPPEPIPNGYMISGMGVPDIDVHFAEPAQLQDDLLKHFTSDQLVEKSVTRFNEESYGEYLLQTVDNNLAVLRYLLHRYPNTNLLCGVFIASDRAQHFYWRQMEDPSAPPRQRTMIREVYVRLDQALGALIAEYPDYTVLVMSDHGAGPYYRLIDLNQWLASHGWLQWQASNGEGLQSTSDWRHWYRQLGLLLPYRLRWQIKNILPTAWMQRLRAEVRRTSLSVHWATTQAYSLGVSGAIYLNLMGREPLGCVRPGHEAEVLLAEINQALYALSDPDTGEPVVERVARGPELYRGPAIHLAPDLVISWKPGYYALSHWSPNGTIFRGHLRWENSEMVHSAEHRPEGILLALGPGIRKGAQVTGASIIDLAPTVLHLMGLPIPSYMDGKVLTELLDARQIGWDPVYVDEQGKSKQSKPSSYSESEEREMINRLHDLGYLG